ncbi:O-antigen ligase family protein [Mycobacterium sp. 4D054]|uniref:O-antigen ligase family protein n=1 Tax=Mycobacterium sp. 4D054 TaxID=3457440 RepID=UPI003FD360AC
MRADERSATVIRVHRQIAEIQVSSAARFIDHLVKLVYFYPILWIAGLGGTFFLITASVGVLYLLRARQCTESRIAIAIAILAAGSVPIGFWYFGFDVVRGLSVLGNIAVWITLAAGLSAARLTAVRPKLSYALVTVAAIQGALTFVSVAIYPAKLPVPLLRDYSEFMPSGLGAFAENSLVYAGWLGSATHRSAGMMANGTWAGAFAALAIIIAIAEFSRRRHRALLILAILLASVSVYYSLSRSTWMLLAVALLAGQLFKIRRRSRRTFAAVLTMVLPLIIVTLVSGRSTIVELLAEVNDQRAGSAESRLAIYERTLQYVWDTGVFFLGFGLKPRESDLVAPVASHSTYIGLLFRAGIICLALLLVLLFRLFSESVKANNSAGIALWLFIACWIAVADVDAGHMAPIFLIFCLKPDTSEAVGPVRTLAT